jgi:hypothetical protein
MINIDEVRPLEFAVDSVNASGSEVSLDAATLAALENITVAGNVELGAAFLAALENVTVSATDLDIRDLSFANDKVDVGGSVIALDSATLAALETVTVLEGAYDSWKSTAQNITNVASQIAVVPLDLRKSITIQNLGSADVYIGSTNLVTILTGTKIPAKSSFSEKLGASATIFAITASGSADVRIAEFAN